MTDQLSCSHPDSSPKASVPHPDASHQLSCPHPDASRSTLLSSTNHLHPTGNPDHMPSLNTLAWLECAATGCDTGTPVDIRHVDNLTAAGGWYCRDHEDEVTC